MLRAVNKEPKTKAEQNENRVDIAQETSKDYKDESIKMKNGGKQRKISRRISIDPSILQKTAKSERETEHKSPEDYEERRQQETLQAIPEDPFDSPKSAVDRNRLENLQKISKGVDEVEKRPETDTDELKTRSAENRDTIWEQSIRGYQVSLITSSASAASRASAASPVSVSDLKNLFWMAEKLPGGDYYDGQWNKIGMAGGGSYTFMTGVEYSGGMSDGRFHGYGVLNYPDGIRVEGKWEMGVLKERHIIFSDDLAISKDDTYAQQPNRRFSYEITMGMKPAGCSILTDRVPTRRIPPGYYDTEDGFYDPVRNVVVDVNDLREIIRIPKNPEWIISHCRKAWDEPVGPRPDLFEKWMECEGPNETN